MDVARPYVCPVLVGRDDLLALAERRIAEVAAGSGRFLVLAGEAGVGKTRLLGTIDRKAQARGFRSIRGGAYPSDLQVAGAILIDLGRAMRRHPAFGALGDALCARLEGDADDQGDPMRRRRLLVLDVAELLAGLAADGPVLIQLEDLHWSDDLTLEVIEAVARRVGDGPLLVVGTYRSDELHPRGAMRAWRARLVAQRMVEEVRLGRLGAQETATMTALLLGESLPVPQDVARAIHERTDGIPLHVEEFLGLVTAAGLSGGDPVIAARGIRHAAVPETVEDAVVARVAQRTPEAVAIARAGAVIGRSFDLDLLVDVTATDPDALSEPLRELAEHALLLPAAAPGRYGFRHALICDAIYASIPEPERRRLHARTAAAARERSEFGTGAFLALHYERAGRLAEAHEAAVAAGDRAATLSSHGDACELYAAALRTAPADLPTADRARLLEGYAASAAAVDANQEAAEAYEAARTAYLEAGDRLSAARLVAPLVAVRHLLGDDLELRTARLRAASAELPPSPVEPGSPGDRAADAVRARLLAASAAAYMLDRRLEEAVAHAEAARSLAVAVGDARVEDDAAATLGTCHVFAGAMDAGWGLLEATVEGARAGRREAEAARAYRMLGSSASVLVEYERAEHWLREGIAYAEAVERWNDRHYMAAHLGHVLWATGDWAAAQEIARQALADGRGGVTTRVTALHVLGFVALGGGDLAEARRQLEEARALGAGMRELQRVGPALWGLAEVALAAGDPSAAIELVDTGVAASARVEDAAYRFPFLVVGVRARLAAGDPLGARRWATRELAALAERDLPGARPAADHAGGLLHAAEGATGRARSALEAAIAGWDERRRVWEGSWARLDLARVALRTNRRAEALALADAVRARATDLPAPALREEAHALRSAVGGGIAPQPWAPLTAREFEVARAVARGLTNVEIAEDLGIARKTAAAHVEHILGKLGVGRRAEIAAWVAGRPVLHSAPHGEDREE